MRWFKVANERGGDEGGGIEGNGRMSIERLNGLRGDVPSVFLSTRSTAPLQPPQVIYTPGERATQNEDGEIRAGRLEVAGPTLTSNL